MNDNDLKAHVGKQDSRLWLLMHDLISAVQSCQTLGDVKTRNTKYE